MDNCDYFDDLNIDMVHGRAVGDAAGTLGGSSANIACAMVGWMFSGTCGGGKAKKTIYIKKVVPTHPINGGMPPGPPGSTGPPGPPAVYLPLGTPNLPPMPPFMDGITPTSGIFYPDNHQIPPVDGTMVPFGPKKPYLFQATDGNTFGGKLPKDKGTTGSYAPPNSSPIHGIMLPVAPGSGIFIPDGMAYPSQFSAGSTPVHAYSIPGFPGHPDIWVPDSDMTNPLRRGDQNTPVQGNVVPDPPNVAQQPPKPGQLLLNKMPILFVPNSLNPAKSVFTDDPHQLSPISGLLIPAPPGNPEVFIPDRDEQVQGLKPPPQGMMTPNPPSPKPAEHGLLFPGLTGTDPLFIPDEAGGLYKFNPTDPSRPPSDGVLTPANPQTINDYFPNQQQPPKPAVIPGVMTPVNNPKKKDPIPGNLIINKPQAPFPFIPNGVGTSGVLKPDDGRPPVMGIWTPGFPGGPDEFVPYDEPTGGINPPMKGPFSPDNNPAASVPAQTGPPVRPGGPPTISGGPRPPANMAPVPDQPAGGGGGGPGAGGGGPGGPPGGGGGKFVPDNPPGGNPSPMNPVSPPVVGQPIPFNPSGPFPPGKFPRGTAEIPSLPPQHGKVVPPLSPGGPATFVPDPAETSPGSFTPSNPPGSQPKPGFIGPPSPPREGEPTKFTPDNPADAPKADTPGTLSLPGQPPDRGVLHPPPYEGAPCPFTPFSPTSFVPDKNPSTVEGSTPPGPIPNGDPRQEVPFYPDNPLQVPPGVAPQRGNLRRHGSPDTPGILKAPAGPGATPLFVPDPINSKPCELVPDQNPMNPSSGSAVLPYNPSDPIAFKPDDKSTVPPGENKGKLRMPGVNPPEQHGTIKNPPDAFSPVLFTPDKPAIFTPSTPPGSPPVPGFKEDPKTPPYPGGPPSPVKFYPSDPAQLTQVPTPGTLSAPSDPAFRPINGLLRPDYPPPAYSFLPFNEGTFTPDDTRVPAPGGVEPPAVPGENPKFYPTNPSSLNPGPTPGTLSTGPAQPEQHGTLQPSPSPPSGPRPFTPDPQGSFYPDSNPANVISTSIQPSGPNPTDPIKIRPTVPGNPIPPGGGTLKAPGKADQHGSVVPPNLPGGPYTFSPDPPCSKPANFLPENNPGAPVPGTYSDNPPSFKPSNPAGLPPMPARGSIQPTNPPGSPPMTGSLSPGMPGGPLNWTPDSAATFHPDDKAYPPVPGTCPLPKTPEESVPFYPTTPSSMPPGTPKGLLVFPGNPDKRGTMEPNPQRTAQPSWTFKPDRPDTTFIPAINPSTQIPGSSSPPSTPGAPFPFFPQNQAQMPPGGPFKGNMNQPGQPSKTGTLQPPTGPGEPYMFQEQPASLFYKDSDPFNPVSGTADRPPNDPTGSLPIPFDPSIPAQFSQAIPIDTAGILKSPGFTDTHGHMDPAKGPGQKPKFYPDPPGSKPASFFPDRSPYAPVEGVLSPGPTPSDPQTFRPGDASKLNPSGEDHGQIVPKVPPGSPPESGTLSPPTSPGAPYTWTTDPEGSTPAWFYEDSKPTHPIRGLYIPPPPGSGPEASSAFKPTNPRDGPTRDEHGQMKRDNPPNSPPEVGTLKPPVAPGLHPFVPDAKTGIPAMFYPDISDGNPIEGEYTPGAQANTPGTFKPKHPPVTAQLPAPGQMCPTGPNQHQVHGVLKAAPFPNMPMMFNPDDKNGIPEYEVSLVPQGEQLPSQIQISQTTTVSIRGSYFKSTITTKIFITYTGTTGIFVINGVPPGDPNMKALCCTFVPKQSGDGDAILTPDSSAAKQGCLPPSQIPPDSHGVFYPAGSTVTGVPGNISPNPNNPAEYIFRPGSLPQEGTWKSETKSGCFMFNEKAQLMPFDMAWIKKREEDYNKPQAAMRAFNFQGSANPQKWDVFIPIEGTMGKFQVANSQTVIHGYLKPNPEGPVEQGAFTPDDPIILQGIASTSGGTVMGSFEQDESPVSTGIVPNNGISGSIHFAGDFQMTFNLPGRKGNLTPGKRSVPGFFVYCFGLIQNVQDTKAHETVSNPVQPGRNLLKGRSFGQPSPISIGRSFGRPNKPVQDPSLAPISGRSMGKVDPSRVTSENMPACDALNQDFGGFLQHQGGPGAQQVLFEKTTETKTETHEETKEETEQIITSSSPPPMSMGMQVAQNQMAAMQQMGGFPGGMMGPPGPYGGMMGPYGGGPMMMMPPQGMYGAMMPGPGGGMMPSFGMGGYGMSPGQGMMPPGPGMIPPGYVMVPDPPGQGQMPPGFGMPPGQGMMPPGQGGMMPPGFGMPPGQGMMPPGMMPPGMMGPPGFGMPPGPGMMPGGGMIPPGYVMVPDPPGFGVPPAEGGVTSKISHKSSSSHDSTEESRTLVQSASEQQPGGEHLPSIGRSMPGPSSVGLVAMPEDLQKQLIALGGRPMTQEEVSKHLTPDMIAQVQAQFQQQPPQIGRSMGRPRGPPQQSEEAGQFIPAGPDEVKSTAAGQVDGVAYTSTTGCNIFVASSGTFGTFHLTTATSTLKQATGKFLNGADLNTASIKSPHSPELVDALKASPTASGVFVPSGGSGEHGAIQVTVSLVGSDIVITLLIPGVHGHLRVGEDADPNLGEPAVTMMIGGSSDDSPQNDGVHGTYYKISPSDVFLADFPGTKGTFYYTASGSSGSSRGLFFPRVVTTSSEMFWSQGNDLESVLPVGKDFILVGKFVLDETIGESAPAGNGGIQGSLIAGKHAKSYIFRPEVLGQSGYISKAFAGSKGKVLGEDKDANFVPDSSVDIYDHPGWKTQFEIIVPNVTLKYDDEIFYGMGNCPHRSNLGPNTLAGLVREDEIIDFYMGLLRTYCLSERRKYVKTLIREGYLQVKNKLIVVPESCKFLKLPKLTQKETEKLSSAFELTVFTLTYADAVKIGVNEASVLTSDGARISRSVKYLLDMSLLNLKMSRELAHRHSVRLSRNLITSLTTVLTKLRQDIDSIKTCDGCTLDRDIIHNDSMQLMGLTQFVIHGLSSVSANDAIRPAFESFYTAHKDLIHRKVVQLNED
ncbi:uncharacterized protein LOC118435267 [Folsomia candida]|uniref:uncharacterized protein LOC118435267 n=1 Tax=Folsomia candida TaxID=158441 RepID=UPI00160535B2|nr:uncharacterized protein LOC118435267 [Folsomia candida]